MLRVPVAANSRHNLTSGDVVDVVLRSEEHRDIVVVKKASRTIETRISIADNADAKRLGVWKL
jgi:bifunctional DNA-binding transcriptional regulator/antitoxin component of YhaV-PrlF toxin-antitoxin module